MKWVSATAIGMVLGLVLDSQKKGICKSISKSGFNYKHLLLEDGSILGGHLPFNSNLIAGSIWFVNAVTLADDVLSMNKNNAEISLINDKGKQVKILLCKKTDVVDLISKSMQVFTPVGYCIWKGYLEKSSMEFLNYDYTSSGVDLQEAINFSIYGGIAATVFNAVGPKFFHEQISFDVPEDLNLYLEHTAENGYIEIQNVIGHAEITVN
jgi:hypothetical protein